MINVFCDKCINKDNPPQLQMRSYKDNSIVIECLGCGDMKRFSQESKEIRQ